MSSNILNDLKERNILKNISSEEKFDNLAKGVGVYTGFDPTAISLHLGNYVQIATLLRFKQFGYHPVTILGGITGMIGDPSFRNSERQFLDVETLTNNKEAIRKQLSKFGLEVIDNYDFYRQWNVVDYLRNLGKLINVNYLLDKENIATRLSSGLSYTEFSYTLIQGWDFKELFERNNVKIQLGGSDQWGNITTGLEIIRKLHGENADAVGVTANLLTDENGVKFGKSTGGGSLWLDPKMTSPYAIYQFLLNQGDIKIEEYLKWLTFLSLSDINEIMAKHNEAKYLRLAQKTLAYEIVKDIHSKQIADQCVKISEILFGKTNEKISLSDLEMLLGFLKSYEIKKDQIFIDFLKENQIVSSNREAREFITKNSFSIDGEIVKDENYIVDFNNYDGKYALLKKGKKEFIIIKKGY
ncbi:tyrosine--tRNA ligase [[Mycoplasma] falconis]|uniref:Tyrosine--tRNA ligase n=1 Tax=[Mycoplasma] falconis TaxID=92403 RepID=A0A501XBQ1_9BACT|nr:tyrosine--tRNA ligase [[Mycoplasma] falconis]TPE58048.1 tyrosine--tRNA ligase [[Mycoplasma] falconis]